MRIALVSLLCSIGCGSSSPPPTVAIKHQVDNAHLPRLAPVVETPAGSDDCPLHWDELAELAPLTIELTPLGSGDPQLAVDMNAECPWFDPSETTCAEIEECKVARMRGERRAALTVGRATGGFVSLGLAIEGTGFACLTGSTIGSKNLYPLGITLTREPWLTDVDGDREAELVVWTRLPWGDGMFANALMPVVYVLDGTRLVRRDDRSRALRKQVSSAYRTIEAKADHEHRVCYASVAAALGT